MGLLEHDEGGIPTKANKRTDTNMIRTLALDNLLKCTREAPKQCNVGAKINIAST